MKHFCLQYKEWEEKLNEISNYPQLEISPNVSNKRYSNPVEGIAEKRLYYTSRMDAVKEACELADPEISKFLFKAVTEDLSYPYLKTVLDIPCGRDYFYERYRKFFFILSDIREKVSVYSRN